MTDRFRASLAALAPLLIAATSFIPSAASAQALFFHVEGAPGDRQAYYLMKPFRISAAAGFCGAVTTPTPTLRMQVVQDSK